MLIRISACMFLLLWSFCSWGAQEKMCESAVAIFQCEMRGGKNLALCPEYVDGDLSGIQYRFGKKNNKEMIFPSNGFGFEGFTFNHYFRYQVSYAKLSFSVGNYKYEIYSNYDGEAFGEGRENAGVVVSKTPEMKDVQMSCIKIHIDNLKKVAPYVTCDKGDALGCER